MIAQLGPEVTALKCHYFDLLRAFSAAKAADDEDAMRRIGYQLRDTINALCEAIRESWAEARVKQPRPQQAEMRRAA